MKSLEIDDTDYFDAVKLNHFERGYGAIGEDFRPTVLLPSLERTSHEHNA